VRPGTTFPAMSTQKVTVPALRARKAQGPKIAMVTAYDATMAKLLEAGGADVLLVGDSLGMVVQGLSNTLPVTLDEMCYHGRAVARAAQRAHVMGDLPFMSYQASPEQAVMAAGKLLKEGGCESVKLEGGRDFAEHVRRIVSASIPVMAHLGLTPQSVHAMGGFRVQGRGAAAAERLVEDAKILEEAGAFALLLEGIPRDLGKRITESVGIPTVGIGAGPDCDGQVLVCYDFLGMYPELRPRFVKRFAEAGQVIVEATRAYVAEVQDGTFPSEAHSFGSSPKAELTGNRPVVGGLPPGYGPASGE
jgi:3-methyl-2-oxobutanoate hydroxymethyltransferase